MDMRHVVAGALGATAATLALAALIIFFALIQEPPHEIKRSDFGLRSLIVVVAIWSLGFTYFALLSIKQKSALRFAICVHLAWGMPLSLYEGAKVLSYGGWQTALYVSLMATVIMSIVMGAGTIASRLPMRGRNKALNLTPRSGAN